MAFLVYAAQNNATGDEYIGVTRQRLNDRRLKHYSDARAGKRGCHHFNAAIRKYGREAFSWSVLGDFGDDVDLAMIGEVEFIAARKPAYNIKEGGRAWGYGPHTKEHTDKVSAKLRGQKRTPEQIERFRQVRADPTYKANQSAALKGRKHSPARIAAMMAGRKPDMNFKPVLCVEDGITFQSQKEAASHYGVARNTMSWAVSSGKPVAGRHFLRPRGE